MDEVNPLLLGKIVQQTVVLRIQCDIVLLKIKYQILRTQDLGDLRQLIRIAGTMKERLFSEDHRGEHGA